MVGLLILVVFILFGIIIGQNVIIPYSSYQYVAVAILACLDSVFGALAASTGKNFKMKIFLSGFFFNAIFAMFLVYLGEILNVEIYLAAVIVFGGRILNNFSIIRRDLMDKAHTNRKKYKMKKKDSNNAIKADVEVTEENI
ncbi:MAG: small basic family protein [Clostridia bacterium]|nr:small basic family protein [Clostridia bacterium]